MYFLFGCTGSSLLCKVFSSRGGHSLWCVVFSLQWLLLLQRMGSKACRLQQLRHVGSAVAAPGLQSTGSTVEANGLSCSMAHGVFPDQGSKPCRLHWQVDSLPLSHQGSTSNYILVVINNVIITIIIINTTNPSWVLDLEMTRTRSHAFLVTSDFG